MCLKFNDQYLVASQLKRQRIYEKGMDIHVSFHVKDPSATSLLSPPRRRSVSHIHLNEWMDWFRFIEDPTPFLAEMVL